MRKAQTTICITRTAKKEGLAEHGFLPGLVRVEEDVSGQLMLADYLHPLERASVPVIDARRLMHP